MTSLIHSAERKMAALTVAITLRASLSGSFLQTARFGYATEGALFISALLSTDAVSALRKVRVLIRLEET